MCDLLYTPGSPIRDLLIKAAKVDVWRYFRPPGEMVLNGREVHDSELDWLVRFDRQDLQDINIARFFQSYRLRCFLQFHNVDNLRRTIQN